ncbi:transcription termination factor 1-like isoform X3 [Vespa velutina]|uniref:transcription termination factor 1-like isoform X3 n=1 Tax=Vespa velutina TaxID=202808 RepID=UPI001FB1C3D1|nr:transcription termination factor 1-like isoform X3 [Vespa velutina]
MSPARLTRNNENEFEYPKAKKRKTSIHDRSVNGSIVRLECNNITSLHAFDTSFLNDFNSINSSKSPEILMENDMIIKAEILDSITIKNENEEIDLIESKDDKCEISERIIKPTCKMTSPMKAKRNKRINGVLIEEEKNIMKELRDIGESEEISDDDKEYYLNIKLKVMPDVVDQGIMKKNYLKSMDRFVKVHNWKEDHVKPFLSLKHNANGLSWRTLYSVYWRFKNLYHNRICQRYSPEEDEKIITYVEKKKNNLNKHKVFSDLSRILNRSKQSIWMHYEFIIKKRNVEEENIYVPKPVWTLPLIKRYIKKLVRLTLCDDIQELKNAIIPKVVWKELEKKLNIDHKTLKNFWVLQLHMQLFCPNIIYMNDVKIQLIEYMFEKGIADSREIVWGNLVKYFDGMTSSFLNKTFVYLMKEFDVKKYRRKSFLDAIEYLYEKKISEIKKHKLDRYLPRIQYTNGNIEIITEEKMNKLGER